MTPLRSIPLGLAVLFLVASCGTGSWFGKKDEVPAPVTREIPGVEARLKPIGSAINGVVRVRESGDLLVVAVELAGASPGTGYRVVFHANGNCSSPNGFSAGAPWSPPGAKEPPGRLVPELYVNSEGNGLLTARLRGIGMGTNPGMADRSVLIYQGGFTEAPRPGVPNNVVACGVFVRSTTLF